MTHTSNPSRHPLPHLRTASDVSISASPRTWYTFSSLRSCRSSWWQACGQRTGYGSLSQRKSAADSVRTSSISIRGSRGQSHVSYKNPFAPPPFEHSADARFSFLLASQSCQCTSDRAAAAVTVVRYFGPGMALERVYRIIRKMPPAQWKRACGGRGSRHGPRRRCPLRPTVCTQLARCSGRPAARGWPT